MSANDVLRLSPQIMPQLFQGVHALIPQNICDGRDRIAYANQVFNILKANIDAGMPDEAFKLRALFPLGDYITTWNEDKATGEIQLALLPQHEYALSLCPEGLTVMFRDGRTRDDSAMIYLETGLDTPRVLELLRSLHRGIARDEFLALAASADVGFDDELVAELIRRGVILETDVVPAIPVDTADGLSWLGHAFMRAVGGGKNIWFDPYPCPRMTWSEKEKSSLFTSDFPDSFLLENFGPEAHHVTQDELPMPDAVFITHQDVDHIDFGALALIPHSVPIYVPEVDPTMPWKGEWVVAVRATWGQDRNVQPLAHGSTITVGDMKVTAFPFAGEFPTPLPHRWNCYYLETPTQVWAFLADSATTQVQVDFIKARRKDDARPFGIASNQLIFHNELMRGYRDSANMFYTTIRLYSWYLNPVSLLAQAPQSGLPVEALADLATHAGLTMFHPYAHGNLPWYRITGTYLLDSHVGSHGMAAFSLFEEACARNGVQCLRLQHGKIFTPS